MMLIDSGVASVAKVRHSRSHNLIWDVRPATVPLQVTVITLYARPSLTVAQQPKFKAAAASERAQPSFVLPLGRSQDAGPWESAEERVPYSFNLAAFQDGRRSLVRIYTEMEPKYVEPIAYQQLNKPHVNQCSVVAENGSMYSVPTLQVDTMWAYGSAERISKVNKVIAYTVDCKDPGKGNFRIAPQLSTGAVIGKHLQVEVLETERKGRLAACSQPLFTAMNGLRDWVDHHARLGVEAFRMHVPVGDHIDALFDPRSRAARIEQTTALNERSPESVGLERLQQFSHPLVKWQEYSGAPTANYYSETPLFNACLYSFRYAYDYVLLYDCDEWFTLRRDNHSRMPYKTIPEFLDRNLPKHVASLQLDSYAFPAQCPMTDRGDFPSRFTLRKKEIWKNMQKLIVRPLAVACTAIHGIFDMTDQFKLAHVDRNSQTIAQAFIKPSTDVAYIKHIRWFGAPNGTAVSCKFGAEAESWDPDFTLVIQDDSPRKPTKEAPSKPLV